MNAYNFLFPISSFISLLLPSLCLCPQRVIIGLRAFLMIADSLEKKEGDPPMPPAANTMLSGSITKTKTKFLTTTLTNEIAKKLGIAKYYPRSVMNMYMYMYTCV